MQYQSQWGILCLWDYEAKYKNEVEMELEDFSEEVRRAAKRGETAIKNLISMGVFIIGALGVAVRILSPRPRSHHTRPLVVDSRHVNKKALGIDGAKLWSGLSQLILLPKNKQHRRAA